MFKKVLAVTFLRKLDLSKITLDETTQVVRPVFRELALKNPFGLAKELWVQHLGKLSPQVETLLNDMFTKSILVLGRTHHELFALAPFKEYFEQFVVLCDSFLAININAASFPLDLELIQAKTTYESLKEKLEKNNHPKKELFNVRSGALFKWCYTAILNLVLEPFKPLFPETNATKLHMELSKIGTKIAIFDTYIDDIADNIQDPFLTDLFCKIPFINPQELVEIQTQLSQYHSGLFLDFFNQTYELWTSIIFELKNLLETDNLEKNPLFFQFQKHISELMDVMNYSAQLNYALHNSSLQKLPNFQEMETNLSANMMVKILFDIQRMALYSHGYELPDCIQEKFNTMTEMLEKAFHHANSFVTYKREVKERDITNAIFKLSETLLENGLKLWQITHPTDSLNTFIQKKYTEGMKFNRPILSFLDLFRDENLLDTAMKKKVLTELTESKDVVFAYFENWSQINQDIGSLCEEMIVDLKIQNVKNKDILISSLRKFKIHNEIFLGFYMIVSSFKGVT